MTTTRISPAVHQDTARPSTRRRTAIAATGVLACLVPAAWTVNLTRMLLTGELADHRFHQLTGQGLLLTTLWLAGLVPLLVAGWRGRTPATSAGLLHLTFLGTGAACSVAAPGGGAPVLVALIAVTGFPVWLAIPRRPRLLGLDRQVDPVLAPVALLTAAFWTPYILDQLTLQNAATGLHAENPHFFDMAWLSSTLVVLALLAATLPAARRLALVTAGASVVIGVAGLAGGDGTTWSLLALALGAATAVAAGLRESLARRG